MERPECQHENPDGSRFCNGWDAKLDRPCSACEHVNPSGSRFCNACGHDVVTAPSPAQPVLMALSVISQELVSHAFRIKEMELRTSRWLGMRLKIPPYIFVIIGFMGRLTIANAMRTPSSASRLSIWLLSLSFMQALKSCR